MTISRSSSGVMLRHILLVHDSQRGTWLSIVRSRTLSRTSTAKLAIRRNPFARHPAHHWFDIKLTKRSSLPEGKQGDGSGTGGSAPASFVGAPDSLSPPCKQSRAGAVCGEKPLFFCGEIPYLRPRCTSNLLSIVTVDNDVKRAWR